MKLFHVVHSEPIGPSFIAYTEPPELTDPGCGFKVWVEETDLQELAERFVTFVKNSKEINLPEDQHFMLEIRK